MNSRNYYDVLEVSPAASAEVIRAAYKSLMQRYHPDKNSDGAEAAERASAVVQAYQVLSDPQKRQAYDATFRNAPPTAPGLRAATSPGTEQAALRRRAEQKSSAWNVWYVWALIGCIIVAGWMNHVISKNKAAAAAVQQAAGSARPNALVPELRVHTIPAFVTNLSVDLAPSAAGLGEVRHVLLIPEVMLRLEMDESERWVRKIEADRAGLTQQLILRLAHARYDDLAGEDGDLYLRQLIEDVVSAGIGLNLAAQVPAGRDSAQVHRAPLRVLLPQLYSVK